MTEDDQRRPPTVIHGPAPDLRLIADDVDAARIDEGDDAV